MLPAKNKYAASKSSAYLRGMWLKTKKYQTVILAYLRYVSTRIIAPWNFRPAHEMSWSPRLPFKLLGQNSTQGLKITEEKVLPLHCANDINKWLNFRVFLDKDVTVKSYRYLGPLIPYQLGNSLLPVGKSAHQ